MTIFRFIGRKRCQKMKKSERVRVGEKDRASWREVLQKAAE